MCHEWPVTNMESLHDWTGLSIVLHDLSFVPLDIDIGPSHPNWNLVKIFQLQTRVPIIVLGLPSLTSMYVQVCVCSFFDLDSVGQRGRWGFCLSLKKLPTDKVLEVDLDDSARLSTL